MYVHVHTCASALQMHANTSVNYVYMYVCTMRVCRVYTFLYVQYAECVNTYVQDEHLAIGGTSADMYMPLDTKGTYPDVYEQCCSAP